MQGKPQKHCSRGATALTTNATRIANQDFYDHEEVERVYYPELEKLLLEFYPDATDVLVYNVSQQRGSGSPPKLIS